MGHFDLSENCAKLDLDQMIRVTMAAVHYSAESLAKQLEETKLSFMRGGVVSLAKSGNILWDAKNLSRALEAHFYLEGARDRKAVRVVNKGGELDAEMEA